MAKLTDKQQRFIIEYIKDSNATKAAIRAGYSSKTAQEQSSRLLSKVMVSRAIDEKQAEIAAAAYVDVTYVLTRLKDVVEKCMQAKPVMVFDSVAREMKQLTDIVEDEDGNVKEVGVYQFDSAGTNKSLELIGRHLKMFTDKLDVDHKGAVQVVYDIPRNKTD